MKSLNQIVEEKKEATHSFCKQNEISLLVLFGSQATGKIHKGSDLDLAVQFKEADNNYDLLSLISSLNELFDRQYLVDLVVLSHKTHMILRYEIFSNGKPLFEKPAGIFREEAYKAWSLFLEARPLIRRFQKNSLRVALEKLQHVA